MSELLRAVSRIAVVGALGSMAAACSSDAMRFAENPFSDPFAANGGEPVRTGSIDPRGPATIAPLPRSTVSSAPLGAPTAAASPARVASTNASPMPSANVAGLNPSYRSTPATAQTTISAAPIRPAQSKPVEVAATTHIRPERTHGTGQRQAQAEPVSSAGRVRPEPVKVVHPRPGRVLAAAAPQAPSRVAHAAKPTKIDQAKGESGRGEPTRHAAAKVEAAKVEAAKSEPLKLAKTAQTVPPKIARAPTLQPAKVAHAPAVPAIKTAQTPAAKPVEPVKVASVAPPKAALEAKPVAKEPESTGALTPAPAPGTAEFRWPARGRVITGFGGSGSNEGINIAVPEGTPVKAAEAGTVAYAGSEVKGYGNLVLIRHDNGFVSAYAHNGEIDVKRGQKVSRGQLIAKSGQSGNVTSPQLHFEIRKGSTPVDPVPHLASN